MEPATGPYPEPDASSPHLVPVSLIHFPFPVSFQRIQPIPKVVYRFVTIFIFTVRSF
jgi:hypothetical protein